MSKKNTTDAETPDFDLDKFLNEIEPPPKLDDKQFDALDAFLESQPNSMHLELMDGFFCGLICGPDATSPEEHIPYIFGGKAPEFDSPAQEEAITTALQQHWDHIKGMMELEGTYYPVLFSGPDFKVSGNEWALGFVLGVEKHRASWQEMIDQAQQEANLLTPILLLYLETSPENKEGPIHAEDREQILTTLIENLPKIYHHFAEARDKKNPPPLH